MQVLGLVGRGAFSNQLALLVFTTMDRGTLVAMLPFDLQTPGKFRAVSYSQICYMCLISTAARIRLTEVF